MEAKSRNAVEKSPYQFIFIVVRVCGRPFDVVDAESNVAVTPLVKQLLFLVGSQRHCLRLDRIKHLFRKEKTLSIRLCFILVVYILGYGRKS